MARGRRLRSRVEFAEQAIIIPEGPHEDEGWRREFQPYAYLVLHLMDTLGFRRFRITGCVQSGKTMTAVVIVALWHLFERKESVVLGVPQMETAEQKWDLEFKPVMVKNPWLYNFFPRKGGGSRGGFAELIKFTNGASLIFMAGGGGDARRSNVTAPVSIKTEVDRYDKPTESSRETSAPEQMSARTEAFDDLAYDYEECTVTTEDGRIWTEVQKGTNTQLYKQCVHCREPVLPDRCDLRGIEDAPDVIAAGETGQFHCPKCERPWTESERRQMVRWDRMIPVHRGQQIKLRGDGYALVEGELPRVESLSIHWNAFDNLFWKTRSIAKKEWLALFDSDSDNLEIKREQFAWARPRAKKEFDLVPLTIAEVYGRGFDTGIGRVPPLTKWVTRQVDLRGTQLHFCTRNWSTEDDGATWSSRAFDIGVIPVSKELHVRAALIEALSTLRDKKMTYFDREGQEFAVNLTFVDGGWMEDVVFAFMLDLENKGIPGWMLSLGRGQSEPPGKGSYVHPQKCDPERGPVLWIGEQLHVRQSNKYGLPFVMVNSDHWKSFVHDGYAAPRGSNGELSHFDPVTSEEKRLLRQHAKEVTAEKRRRRVVPRRGPVDVWTNDSDSPNHGLDTEYGSCAAANVLGVRVVTRERPAPPQRPAGEPAEPLTMPDGRQFLAMEQMS